MELKPIPQLVHVACSKCKGVAVAEKGQKVLCQNCVNEFLASKVGIMEELPAQEFIPNE